MISSLKRREMNITISVPKIPKKGYMISFPPVKIKSLFKDMKMRM